MLATGNRPTDSTFLAAFTPKGLAKPTIHLPGGFVYGSFREQDGRYFVSRLAGRNADLAVIDSRGGVTSVFSTPSFASQIVPGQSLGDSLWLSDSAAKLSGLGRIESIKTGSLLSRDMLLIRMSNDLVLLIDKPSGALIRLNLTNGDRRKIPRPTSLAVDSLVQLNERRGAIMQTQAIGAKARGSVHLVLSADSDQEGHVYLLMAPYSLREGALVIVLDSHGQFRREWRCTPPRGKEFADFAPRFIVHSRGNGICLVSRLGQGVWYRLDR